MEVIILSFYSKRGHTYWYISSNWLILIVMYAICSQATWLVMVSCVMTRNYMGAWRTWRRPPTSSLLLDWSCRRTRRRRRRRLQMGAWRTWRRPPTSSLLLDWSWRQTRRRRRLQIKCYIQRCDNTIPSYTNCVWICLFVYDLTLFYYII